MSCARFSGESWDSVSELPESWESARWRRTAASIVLVRVARVGTRITSRFRNSRRPPAGVFSKRSRTRPGGSAPGSTPCASGKSSQCRITSHASSARSGHLRVLPGAPDLERRVLELLGEDLGRALLRLLHRDLARRVLDQLVEVDLGREAVAARVGVQVPGASLERVERLRRSRSGRRRARGSSRSARRRSRRERPG